MYKLLRDYLYNQYGFKDIEIQSYNIEGNICICIYSYYSGNTESIIYDITESINIWNVLDFVYNNEKE